MQTWDRSGVEHVGISDDGSHQLQIIRADTLDREIARDEANLQSSIRSRATEQARHAEAMAAVSLDGFEATISSPALRARVVTALTDRGCRSGGTFYRNIRDLVRHLVHDRGFTTTKMIGGTRCLVSPDGSFFDEKTLTKSGIDYALYLAHLHH